MNSRQQPNILWICTDQQRWDTLGCAGNRWVTTPNIDRLAGEGMRFDHAYCQSPVCTPSRASFLTGRTPNVCGARSNGVSIPQTEVLVTRMLADAGYTCGLTGKLHISAANPDHVGPGGREHRINDGYSEFKWSHHSRPMGHADNDYHTWLHDKGLEWRTVPFDDCPPVSTSMTGETSQMAWCAENAIGFMSEQGRAGKPWLYSINPFDPHHPFSPPAEYLEPYLDHLDDIPLPAYVEGELEAKQAYQRYSHENGAYGGWVKELAWPIMRERDHRLVRAAYWAMCDQIDFHVGRVLAALEDTGQRENTIVIFTSDHGELLGDHGLYYKGAYFYDCAVRVPLIVSMPGTITTGTSTALVELMDLSQTLLDAAGLDHHPGMMGRSLWPLLTGASSADNHRDSVFCEYYSASPDKNDYSERVSHVSMVRTRSHKVVVSRNNCGELYDLEADPGEHSNLWDEPVALATKAQMLASLSERLTTDCDPLPVRQAVW